MTLYFLSEDVLRFLLGAADMPLVVSASSLTCVIDLHFIRQKKERLEPVDILEGLEQTGRSNALSGSIAGFERCFNQGLDGEFANWSCTHS